MIDLYFAPTGNGQRARIALEEAGLRYRLHKVDFANKGADFLAVNPVGAIPAIVDDDGPGGQRVTLAQSSAILIYAANKAGRLWPASDAGRLAALQWMMMAATDAAPASGVIFLAANALPDKTPANGEFLENRLLNFFRHFDRRLAGRDYLADEFSVADIALYPVYAARKGIVEKSGGLTNLDRWATSIAARPAVRRAMKAD